MAFRATSRLRGLHIIGQMRQFLNTQASQHRLASSHASDILKPGTVPHQVKISANGKAYEFDCISLRDSCSCARCVDPSTSQKLFDTASIPFEVEAIQPVIQPDGSLNVKWRHDIPGYEDHTSVYPPAFFLSKPGSTSRFSTTQSYFPRISWDREIIGRNSDPVDFASYMSSSATLHKALSHLQHYGLLFLSSVPSDPGSIEIIANRIGPLRHTFYGSAWDVRSVPSAKNIAYTSSHLGFHMVSIRSIFAFQLLLALTSILEQDLLYCETPPKLQILHCMKASTAGGQSLFSDSFNAIEKMKSTLVTALAGYFVRYHYNNDGQYYSWTRKTVEYELVRQTHNDLASNARTNRSRIKAVSWSPPFQAPLLRDVSLRNNPVAKPASPSNLWNYLKAAKVFKGLIEDEGAVFETKMAPGTCVIFDNRRILHARKAFDGEEGERWLRGAYIDEDAFKSRMRVLSAEFGAIIPPSV